MSAREMSLKGKTALVTGASRGIGRAIAIRLAAESVDLVVAARSGDELHSLRADIEALNQRCLVIPTDLRAPESIQNLSQQILSTSGHIDILVNNAGVGVWAPVTEITLQQYDEIFDVNMRAVFLLTQAILPALISHRRGHIINIASTSSRWTYPEGSVYCASKFAVLGFSEALAKELRTTGVRVTAICPGSVNTYLGGGGPEDWVPGMLEPEDVAELVIQTIYLPPHAIVTEMVIWPQAEEF